MLSASFCAQWETAVKEKGTKQPLCCVMFVCMCVCVCVVQGQEQENFEAYAEQFSDSDGEQSTAYPGWVGVSVVSSLPLRFCRLLADFLEAHASELPLGSILADDDSAAATQAPDAGPAAQLLRDFESDQRTRLTTFARKMHSHVGAPKFEEYRPNVFTVVLDIHADELVSTSARKHIEKSTQSAADGK